MSATSPVELHEPLRTIVQTILQIARPECIVLFGSRATGQAGKESDYDFLVVMPDVKNEREISRRIYRALLEKKTGAAVDTVVVSRRTLKRHEANPYFIYHQALREGKVLYERKGT